MPSPRRRRTAEAAFTLIELMIVVAIVGVLASAAIPSFARYVERSRRVEGLHNIQKIGRATEAYFDTWSKMPAYTTVGPWSLGYFYGPYQMNSYSACKTNGGLIPAAKASPFVASPAYKQVADALLFKPEGDLRYDYTYLGYSNSQTGYVYGYAYATRYTSCGAKTRLHRYQLQFRNDNGTFRKLGPVLQEYGY